MITSAPIWPDATDSRTNRYVGRWMRHFPLLRATSLEVWIEGLRDVALPAVARLLTPHERDLLIDEHWRRETERPTREPEEFDELVMALEELVVEAQRRSPVGAGFVRLGFRAPTDSTTARSSALQVDGGPEALEVILESERVFDDLCLAQECGHAPALVVRPWVEIPHESELRAFIRGRRLVGLSQRRLEGPLRALVARGPALEAMVRRRCGELAERWPMADLVVDFVCVDEQAWLVDLHPWLPWTDPALYRWEEDAFREYGFRYIPLDGG